MIVRLIGTQVSLIGATTNTSCGTIDTVNTTDGYSVEAQTYTVPCPATTEPTLAVFVYDNEGDGKWNYMNIAEVEIYSQLTGTTINICVKLGL